jgi:TonB family protein
MKKQNSFLKISAIAFIGLATFGCSDEDFVGMEPVVNDATAVNSKIPEKLNGEVIFTGVETPPEFKGGAKEMYKYIGQNMKYPKDAQTRGIDGRVFIKFIVDKEGNVQNPVILKGVDPSLDAEAIRVISELPQWDPGFQNGKPVNVFFTTPVVFRLE